jgi:hypothetical protein
MSRSWFLLIPFPLLVSTGCIPLALVLGNPAQRAAVYQRVIDEAVGDAQERKDCPSWIPRLNSIREKLPTWSENTTTWYGDAVLEAYHACTLAAVEDFKVGTGSRLERSKRALANFDLVLSLPLDDLKIDDLDMQGYAKVPVRPGLVALQRLRAETAANIDRLEQERAEKVAREAKRLEAAKTAESKGWLLAAIAAWSALDPMDDEAKAAKKTALSRLAAPAREQLAVTVSIAPAKTDGAPEAVIAHLRDVAALTNTPKLEIVKPGAAASVQVQLSFGAIKRDTIKQSVSLQHVYVSGTKMVPNPEIEKLRESIAYHEKEAAEYEEGARNACNSMRDKVNCTTRDIRKGNAKEHRRKEARDRERLAREKPTVRKDVNSVFEYEGEKTVFTATAPVGVLLGGASTASPALQKGTAKIEKVTISYPGNPSVRLASRRDAAPSASDLDEALTQEVVRMFVNGILPASTLVAGEFDQKAAASKEPLEKLHYAVLRALRSGADADRQRADALAKELLESTTDASALLRLLGGGPTSGSPSASGDAVTAPEAAPAPTPPAENPAVE